VGGYQIIDWVLEVGNQRFTNRDEAKRLRWGPGQPVALTVRWASDAPRRPVASANAEASPWTSVDGRTVTYRFANRWSLLSALEVLRARPSKVAAFTDLEPQTLELAITTKRVAQDLPDTEPTQVFVRLSVLAPDSSDTLTLPSFPDRAPVVDRPKGRLS
jgi:type VI secretion system protein ImpL